MRPTTAAAAWATWAAPSRTLCPLMAATMRCASRFRRSRSRTSNMKAKATRKPAVKPAGRGMADGRVRAVIDRVLPEVDGGRFAVKRTLGETMVIEAHVFADGHDALACRLGYRHESDSEWTEIAMTAL